MQRKQKRYTGRRNSAKKAIAAVLALAGIVVILGGAGGLEHECMALKDGIMVMISGCASMVIGLRLGGAI